MSQEIIDKADARTKHILTTLRQRRVEVEMSQDKLGRSVGLDHTAISGIERGRRKLYMSEFYAIAQVLGLDPRQLIVEAHNE